MINENIDLLSKQWSSARTAKKVRMKRFSINAFPAKEIGGK